jgi:hypothetical protein
MVINAARGAISAVSLMPARHHSVQGSMGSGRNRMRRRVTCAHRMELTCGQWTGDAAARVQLLVTVDDSNNLPASFPPERHDDFMILVRSHTKAELMVGTCLE